MSTMNLTQHAATADQVAVGVFDLPAAARADLQALLTFGEMPDAQEIRARAGRIAALAVRSFLTADEYWSAEKGEGAAEELRRRNAMAMMGGALWLMAPLATALREQGINPVFAFSVREAEEQRQADGSVQKVAVFRHAGFVPAVE